MSYFGGNFKSQQEYNDYIESLVTRDKNGLTPSDRLYNELQTSLTEYFAKNDKENDNA